MSSAVATLNALERLARREQLRYAVDMRFGRCDRCGRVRDDDGKLLYVARQPRRAKFECLECFDGTRDQEVAG